MASRDGSASLGRLSPGVYQPISRVGIDLIRCSVALRDRVSLPGQVKSPSISANIKCRD